jgi:potassium efflux system protein
LEAFQENGILIPSRQAEVTLQTIDLLRETAQYLSNDPHKPRAETRKPTAELVANLSRKSANLVGS